MPERYTSPNRGRRSARARRRRRERSSGHICRRRCRCYRCQRHDHGGRRRRRRSDRLLGANHVKTWPAPDYCIIGEPSSWDQICLGYRGTISFEYVLRQDSRHTAGPGESVAEQAVTYWTALTARLAAINGDAAGFNAIGPSLRSFNTSGDGLQDEARLSIGLRLPPSIGSHQILPIVHELAGKAEITVFGVQEGYQTDKRSPLTAPFLRAIRARGGTPRFTRKLGTSDMSVVGPVWQCPIVAYGPGDSSLDHTPEERIVIDDYLSAVWILTEVLNTL
ncbi:MAG: M20/M25/M40 family metallo-hydrolase [Thermomicrobiales bacterium]